MRIRRPQNPVLGAFFASVAFVCCASIPAQISREATVEDHEVVVRRWSVEDGLPQASVRTIGVESSGHVLVGTEAGLARFDGLRFESVPCILRQSLGIKVLVPAPSRELHWALADDGSIWAVRSFGPTQRTGLAAALGSAVRTMTVEPDGSLICSTKEGLFRARSPGSEQQSIERIDYPVLSKLMKPWVNLQQASDGSTAVRSGKVYGFLEPGADSLHWEIREKNVKAVDRAKDGTVFLLILDKVLRRRPETGSDFEVLPVERGIGDPMSMAIVDGTLWWGSGRGEIWRLPFDCPLEDVQREVESVRIVGRGGGSRVHAFTGGLLGDVWIGSEAGGLVQALPMSLRVQRLRDLDGGGDYPISVTRTEGGALYVGGRRSGFWYSAGATQPLAHLVSPYGRGGISAFSDRGDEAWLFSWKHQNRSTDGVTFARIFEGAMVRDTARGPSGRLWLGTSEGLLPIDTGSLSAPVDKTPRPLPIESRLFDGEDIWAVEPLGDRFLIGGNDVGLFEFDPESGLSRKIPIEGTSVSAVGSIHVSGDVAWIGLLGGRFALYREGRAVLLDHGGLQVVNVLGFAEEGGRLWASTTRGLLRFDPERVLQRLDENRVPHLVGDWISAVDMGVEELNGMGGSSIATDGDGTIHVPAVEGLVSLKTTGSVLERPDPRAALRRVRIDSDEVDEVPRQLDPLVNRIAFGYRVAAFESPLDFEHQYRLCGHETEWRRGRRDSFVEYSNLAPGDYRFEVRVQRAGHEWTGPTVLASFEVMLPFYRREWFPWAVLALLGMIGMTSARWSRGRARSRETRLAQLIDSRTEALRSEIDRRERIEQELRLHQEELDLKIERRTADLAAANERLREELEQRDLLEKELVGAQKMEGVALLAGGIAHDLNNLLTAVLGFSDMARASVESDHPAAEDLSEIRLAASNAADLTQRLLTFARQQPMHEVVADLNEIVESFSGILQGLVGESRELSFSLSEARCPVVVDRVQFEQVIVNLVLNAKDATSSGGKIQLRTRSVGDRCLLEVEDDGMGISADRIADVFEPFVSTKSEGTGLGLSISRSIVERLLGSLEVRSEPGEGACFTVDLPSAEGVVDAQTEERVVEVPRAQSVRILLVEDQQLVRTVTRRALVDHGHEVVEACDGSEALTRYREAEQPFDIVLSDVVMPGLSGPDLIERLREDDPRLQAVLMTGYSPESVSERMATLQVDLLRKPFTTDTLLRVIDAAAVAARTRRPGAGDDQERNESSFSS